MGLRGCTGGLSRRYGHCFKELENYFRVIFAGVSPHCWADAKAFMRFNDASRKALRKRSAPWIKSGSFKLLVIG